MARGDGKAVKGRTKGRMLGVKRMATGGFAASSREGGFAAAGPSRLESPGQRASVSPGAGNISAGRIAGGGGRSDPRNAQSNAARVDYLTNPTRASVRLGPNAAQAMADAGVSPDTATHAAKSINRLAADRMGSPVRTQQSPTEAPRFRSGYADQQSIVPGTVSFTQENRFTPFAQTAQGKALLQQAQQPLTYEQAKTLKSKLPPDTKFKLQTSQMPPGYTSYPVTAAGYKLNVGIPDSAGVNTLGPKVGQFNQTAQVAAPLTGYTGQDQRFPSATSLPGQEQRFPPAGVPKQFDDRIQPGGTKQFYDRILPEPDTPRPAAADKPKASPVVAGKNFTAGASPFRDRGEGGGGGGRRRRKKPIIEETTTAAKHGGIISRGDGKVSRGKTKGRQI